MEGLTKMLGMSVFLVALSSCGAAGFGYRFYTIVPSEDKLLAADAKDDLVLSKECEPERVTETVAADAKVMKDMIKCYAMKAAEFESMKLELKQLRQKLIDCQKGRRGD